MRQVTEGKEGKQQDPKVGKNSEAIARSHVKVAESMYETGNRKGKDTNERGR